MERKENVRIWLKNAIYLKINAFKRKDENRFCVWIKNGHRNSVQINDTQVIEIMINFETKD